MVNLARLFDKQTKFASGLMFLVMTQIVRTEIPLCPRMRSMRKQVICYEIIVAPHVA